MNNPINTTGPAPQQIVYVTHGKSRAAYIVFALFFGGIGIHDFYAGFVGKGLLKIIISFLGWFLFLVGGVGTVAGTIANEAPVPNEMAMLPMIGLLMLGLQSLYVLVQIFIQNSDAQGVPFS